MPFFFSASALLADSFQFEFPPSMMTSPSDIDPISASSVESVMGPAGTMIQTTRGASSLATRSLSEVASSAPAWTTRSRAS